MKKSFTQLPPSEKSSVIFRRLMREYILPHRRVIFFAMICMIISAGLTAMNAWMMQPALDKIFFEKNARMLTLIPLGIILITIALGAANYGHTILMRFVGQRIIATMQVELYSHLLRSDLALFHDRGAGHLISRFTNDINMMRASVSSVMTGLAKEFLTMIFLVGVMFYQSWQLTLIAFTVFPTAVWPVIRMGKRMRKLSDGTQKQLGEFTERLDETFQGVRMVRAYAREAYEGKRASTMIEDLFRLYIKSSRVQAAASPIMEVLGGVAIAAVVWYGGIKVIHGVTTPGAFFSFITAMILAYRPAKVITGLNTNLQEGLAAANRLFQVLDIHPTIADRPGAAELNAEQATIRYEQVGFRYAADSAGVDAIDITIPAGKTAALVGASGSGKSTLMNLLLRFYEVSDGSITINGTDIRDATLNSLRNAMALVSQETVLFDDSVRANIAYGKLDATQKEIETAAERAAADEFIQQLPQGYDTMIGPHGVRLSGGQRQRLAIARAMLKDAPILLLDEATSSLDTTSERLVQHALETLMKNRTTLVIAHRLSTIMHADIIYVMKAGRIVEQGTHEQLLAQRREYYRLYSHQFDALDREPYPADGHGR